MLIHYHVKNFALIEDARVDFGPGLNVLTGETGAGKSIMIDALSAALGSRAGADNIRRGAQEAMIELVFQVDEPPVLNALSELDIENEDGQIVLSRRIGAGKSLYKINDEIVTLNRLRKVTELLIDIHGQHEHQSILKSDKQLAVFDEFAGSACVQKKEDVRLAYHQYKEALKELEAFAMPEEERTRRLDFLYYEINEIEQANVKSGEKAQLEQEYKTLSAGDKIKNILGKVLDELSEGSSSAEDHTGRAIRLLSDLEKLAEPANAWSESLTAAEDMIATTARDIYSYLDHFSLDAEELSKVEKRLDELHRLALKYGDLSDDANPALSSRREEAASLENYEEKRLKAAEKLQAAREKLNKQAEELRKERMKAAPVFREAMIREMRQLNFASVDFDTVWENLPECAEYGSERVNFMVSLNPGEPLLPLQTAPSGGELSRIMLAIKTILADKDQIPTLIFDEIDSGISGETAGRVGEKLKRISKYRQVILITHLPQIAAPADRHYEIKKINDHERAVTTIRLLEEEESVREIARLLGGSHISDTVLETARELKTRSQ